jgi:hypothetical protein
MNRRHAGFIGTLLNTRDQSDPVMRDAAVFVSLSSPDTSIRGHASLNAQGGLGCGSGL